MTRNPRRAYDAEWREIEPMSLPPCASTGWATCEDCKHKAIINLDSLPDRLYVPDVALRLRCSACGSKKIATRRREIPCLLVMCSGRHLSPGFPSAWPRECVL